MNKICLLIVLFLFYTSIGRKKNLSIGYNKYRRFRLPWQFDELPGAGKSRRGESKGL